MVEIIRLAASDCQGDCQLPLAVASPSLVVCDLHMLCPQEKKLLIAWIQMAIAPARAGDLGRERKLKAY